MKIILIKCVAAVAKFMLFLWLLTILLFFTVLLFSKITLLIIMCFKVIRKHATKDSDLKLGVTTIQTIFLAHHTTYITIKIKKFHNHQEEINQLHLF